MLQMQQNQMGGLVQSHQPINDANIFIIDL